MAAFAPSHQVLAAAFLAQVTVRDRRDELDPLRFGQAFNRGVTNDRGDLIRPLDRRHCKRGIAVARERASLICVGLAGDQHLAVAALEPDRQHSRVPAVPGYGPFAPSGMGIAWPSFALPRRPSLTISSSPDCTNSASSYLSVQSANSASSVNFM